MSCKDVLHKCKAECCSVVPIPKVTWDSNQDKIVRKPREVLSIKEWGDDVVVPVTENAKCPFLTEDLRCNIYDQRPNVCKEFSSECHPFMTCTHIDKRGKPRSRQARRLIERMLNKFNPVNWMSGMSEEQMIEAYEKHKYVLE